MKASKSLAKKQIKSLIDKYNRYKKQDLLKKYNEENTCKDFILPLFSALGWGVQTSKEVEAQKKVSKGWVDYAFYLDGIPKFFLEAKAIPEDLHNLKHIKQAIDYAYNKGVTWAVLSDFEGIMVFNSEWHTDPLKARVLNILVDDYLKDFDLLWELSKEGFKKELLYQRARKFGQVAIKEPAGERLYKDLTKWREIFFKFITGYHRKDFTFAQVDEIIQRILNRLVFIRTCEDRKIEQPYLLPMVREWEAGGRKDRLEKDVQKLFRSFDEWYDSKLFLKHTCDQIDTQDDPYKEVIEGLHGSKDGIIKYDFNAIDVDVLGRVYEQYLGYVAKTIDPKKKKQLAFNGFETLIKVEKEKRKRKEHGIYYTPKFVVDYIVRNTLGKFLEEKNHNEILNIKVLDPACGSGSFLIAAYDLLDKHHSKIAGKETGGHYDRIRILTQNIYGVDLDPQAAEITRLNLLLKTLTKRERLPLLTKNIKEGNSLISGTKKELKRYFGENWEEEKPFNWKEKFPEAFRRGGFDVIIGNPPYVRQEEIKKYKKIFARLFPNVASGTADLYVYFFGRAMQVLKNGGYFGFITSNKFIRADYGKNLRRYLQNNFKILQVVDKFDVKVFIEATVDPCIIILKKEKPGKNHKITYNYKTKVLQNSLSEKGWTFARKDALSLKRKIEKNGIKLKDWDGVDIYFGIKSGLNKVFIINEDKRNELIDQDKNSNKIIKPVIRGRDIKRYQIKWKGLYFILAKIGVDLDKYPAVYKYLKSYKDLLVKRTDYKPKLMQWYNLRPCDYYDNFNQPKIIYPDISQEGSFYWDEDGYFLNDSAHMLIGGKKSWVALLNSKLIRWYIKQTAYSLGDEGLRLKQIFIREIPITGKVENLRKLSDKMFKLNKDISKCAKDSDKYRTIQAKIEKVDKQINQLVYKLYNLALEEIKIVEKSTK